MNEWGALRGHLEVLCPQECVKPLRMVQGHQPTLFNDLLRLLRVWSPGMSRCGCLCSGNRIRALLPSTGTAPRPSLQPHLYMTTTHTASAGPSQPNTQLPSLLPLFSVALTTSWQDGCLSYLPAPCRCPLLRCKHHEGWHSHLYCSQSSPGLTVPVTQCKVRAGTGLQWRSHPWNCGEGRKLHLFELFP